jgi:glycosyltransferase involved in cell wall biosynthesis
VLVDVVKHLDRRRFRVSLAVVDMSEAVFQHEIPTDVDLFDLNALRVRRGLPRIVSLIWRRRPNVVFSTLGHLNLALAMARFLLPRDVRTVARETIVVSCALAQQPRRRQWAALYRWFYRAHDRVVCQSRDMRDDLVGSFGFPPQKTSIIYNPVDILRIRTLSRRRLEILPTAADGAIRFVAAGRLDHQKGFDLLIDAIASLKDPSINLVLLGEGPWRERLNRQVVERGLENQIRLVGFQSNPYAWFAHADAFVLSSRYEGFPNVVLEALTCGTPVIATPAPGGTREILTGVEECVIAESICAEALAQAIRVWLKGARARIAESVVDPYRIERIIHEYEAVLSEEVRV